LRSGVFARATINLLTQTVFRNIAATNSARKLLQVFKDTIRLPATTDVMADDRVEHIGSISPRRSTFTHDPFDFIEAIFAAATVKAITADRCRLDHLSLAALAPYNCPAENVVDVGKLVDCGIERVATDRQCFIGASEKLSRDLLAVHVQRELGVDRVTVCQAPNTNAFAAWRDFLICMDSGLHKVLRPDVDRAQLVPAMIKIDCTERVILRQYIREPV